MEPYGSVRMIDMERVILPVLIDLGDHLERRALQRGKRGGPAPRAGGVRAMFSRDRMARLGVML
jgi:hypothetical protein